MRRKAIEKTEGVDCYFRHSNLSGLAVHVPMYRCYTKSPRFLYGMREPTRHPFLYI